MTVVVGQDQFELHLDRVRVLECFAVVVKARVVDAARLGRDIPTSASAN